MSAANFSPDNIRDDDDSRSVRVKARNNFNYVTLALNAIQDAFKQAIQDVQDSIIKPALRGGFNINDIRYYGTLANAIASIPTGSAQTIYITTALSITANTTVPSNLSLVVVKGGSFAISGGVTLTINGPFEGQGLALADIFTGAGAFVFGKALRIIGAGSPETVVTAPIGSEFLRNNGGADTTLYIKESGSGNTGWKAISGTNAVTGGGAATRVAYWSSATALTSSANLTFDGNQLNVGDAAVGGDIQITGKTGFTNNYAFDLSSTSGTLDIRVNSGVERFVQLTNVGAGTLSLLADGNIKITEAGSGLYVKEGTNATMGNGQLAGGVLVVNTTRVTANSEIFIGDKGGGVLANAGALYEDSAVRVAGTSFTVKSLNILDTSKFCWMIVEPA